MIAQRRRLKYRSQKGAMGTVLFLLVIQICFVAAALSVDIAHQISVRAELQAATDAAAMAGEEVLLAQSSASSSAATAAALSICNANYCDGKPLSANSKAVINTTISQTGGSPSLPTLKVSASVPAVNMFGILLGHGSDTLNVSSTAGPGEVGTAFGAFPMTVVNRNYQPNTTYTWYISDAPGLVPGLVNAISSGLTGYSVGSTPPPYPNNMLGYNTARFLTTYNANLNTGLLGATQSLANGVGGP
jgi:Flp pilus assembly protein TadG